MIMPSPGSQRLPGRPWRLALLLVGERLRPFFAVRSELPDAVAHSLPALRRWFLTRLPSGPAPSCTSGQRLRRHPVRSPSRVRVPAELPAF